MKIPKFLLFVLIIFILGLIQYWVAAAILWYRKIFDIDILLRDGGLFFFSTSLVYTSFYTGQEYQEKGDWYKLWSASALTIVSALAVVAYCITFTGGNAPQQQIGFTDNIITGEKVCLAVASLYATYIYLRSGKTHKNAFIHI